MSLSLRDTSLIWHPYTQVALEAPPVAVVRGEGSLIWDECGKEYIDAISSWWVNLHGHAHPHISKRISAQLDKFHHVIFAGFTHQPAIELAEGLRQVIPVSDPYFFFSDDGSTAVEAAVKMSLQYRSNKGEVRRKVLALEGAYHGDTFGAMSVSAKSSFREPFDPYLFEVCFLPRPTVENFNEVKAQLESVVLDASLFIFEPLLQGASGMNIYPANLLSELIGICRQAGVITIADEVFTGFGRTGSYFASDFLDERPDIFCLSKGLTGGTMPLGLTIAPRRIYDVFKDTERAKMFLHGHSYTANPLACAAGCASLELLRSVECQASIKDIEASHKDFIAAMSGHPKIRHMRSLGTVLALEIGSEDTKSYLSPLRDRLYKFYLDSGVLLRPLGNTVYTVPPYSTTREQLQRIYHAIIRSLEFV